MCAGFKPGRPWAAPLLWVSALCLVSLSGCDLLSSFLAEDIENVQQQADELKNQAKAKVEPKPEVKEDKEAKQEYKRPELAVRRDPFIFEPPEDKLTPEEEERELEPLEAYAINQLRLVALVTGTAVPKAMFQVGSGDGLFAKEGDRIGRDGGRITEIRDNEVEITIAGATQRAPEPGEDPQNVTRESEPTTVIIRLSDTDIELAEETTEEEQQLLDSIDNPKATNDGAGALPPSSPVAPPPEPVDGEGDEP